jgi:ABC-2 type transport system ATP-binding protein
LSEDPSPDAPQVDVVEVDAPQVAAIEVKDLVKSYEGAAVVDSVDLSVPVGTLCALLGPNGAGKTTLSECISGFRRPDRGRVRVLGHDPFTQRSQVTAALGVMLQEGGAYPSATPREMLELYARFHRDSSDPGQLLEFVGLADRADTRYRRLSGGQKQRLNLALALVGRPRVLVLDEPTAAMDPAGRSLTWDLLRSLGNEGVGVLFTTHDLREAERLADRVLVIDRGQIVADDTPSRLVAALHDERVLVTTPVAIDAAGLATTVGAHVTPDGDGRWILAADASAIPAITAWFSRNQLPLTGVTAVGGDLESVFARLVAEPGRVRPTRPVSVSESVASGAPGPRSGGTR